MARPMVVRCECGKPFSSMSAMKQHITAVHKGVDPAKLRKTGWVKRLFKKIFRRS